jgi:hypothetical protein
MTANTIAIGLGTLLIFELILLVVMVVAWLQIITKAGYSGWWILLALVPFVNGIMFLVFAFSKWPIQRRLAAAQWSTEYQSGPGGRYSWPSENPYSATPPPGGSYASPRPRPASSLPRESADLPPFGSAGVIAPSITPGWHPVEGDRMRVAYWDGSKWTAYRQWDGQQWVTPTTLSQPTTP